MMLSGCKSARGTNFRSDSCGAPCSHAIHRQFKGFPQGGNGGIHDAFAGDVSDAATALEGILEAHQGMNDGIMATTPTMNTK
jgi:hypothetical protein